MATWINGGAGEYFGSPTEPLGGSSAGNEKQKNNAICVFEFFSVRGWTVNAIAALCGNMQQESTINPNSLEFPSNPSIGGYGLVQWTPHTDLYNILDYLYGSHTDWYDGTKQCNAIQAEYLRSVGRIPASSGIDPGWYPNNPNYTFQSSMTFDEFIHSTLDAGYLADVMQVNYERPAAYHAERQALGRAWYQYLSGHPVPPTPGRRRKSPFWIYLRYRWR